MKASQARSSKRRKIAGPVDKHRRATLRSTVELMGTAVLLAAGWIGLVASTKAHEMLLGVGVVALLTPFAASLLRSEWLRFSFRIEDLLQCWRIPWYVLSGCGEITGLLLRDLFAGRRTGSYYRACSFTSTDAIRSSSPEASSRSRTQRRLRTSLLSALMPSSGKCSFTSGTQQCTEDEPGSGFSAGLRSQAFRPSLFFLEKARPTQPPTARVSTGSGFYSSSAEP
jgi:hypothetical protein